MSEYIDKIQYGSTEYEIADAQSRDDVGDLKSAIDKSYYTYIDATKWESGHMNTSTGANANSSKKMRTGYLPFKTVAVSAKSGYKYAIYAYNKSNSNYVGVYNGTTFTTTLTWFTDWINLRVIGDYKYRLVGSKADESTITLDTDAQNIVFADIVVDDLTLDGYAANAKAVGDAIDAEDDKIELLESYFASRGFMYIDDTYIGMTKAIGKSADSSGLSDSANITTYYFTAQDDFKTYITDYNETYTCLALYNGEISSANYIGRYRNTNTPNDLPQTELTAIDILKGYTVAISVNNNNPGTFRLYTNSNSVNGQELSDHVYLGESQIDQVLKAARQCKVQYIGESGAENSTERLNIFIPTESGYIQHMYVHTVKASINADTWRLGPVFSCNDSLQQVNSLTYSGEWECAVHLKDRDDFSGGNAHGDEVQTAQHVWLDGVYTTLSSLTTLTDFDELRIVRRSNLFDPADHTTVIAEHGTEYIITKDGIQANQSVKWLAAYTITACYLGMFPVMKADGTTPISSYLYNDKDFDYQAITSPINRPMTYARKLVLTNTNKNIMFVFDGIKCPTKMSANRMLVSDNGGLNYHKCYDVVNSGDTEANVDANEYWMSTHLFKIIIGASN